MFVASRRFIALTSVIIFLLLLLTFQAIRFSHVSVPKTLEVVKNATLSPTWTDINPFWTTEQEQTHFAYVQYATTIHYLCNAIINFHRLARFAVKQDMVLIFPTDWTKGDSREAKVIKKFHAESPHVVLRPYDPITTHKGDSTWAESLTKFHAFDLTDYSRVLAFDSDTQVLNNMDHYFLAPLAAIAVPRAYWLTEKEESIAKQVLGSHVMLLEPNKDRYRKILDEAQRSGDFDMEVLNTLFKDSAMILPHRRLALLTGEFRAQDHKKYLAPDEDDEWNAMGELSRAYLVHFSDWPLPKPWLGHSKSQWEAALPACPEDDEEKEDRPRCADRVMWSGIYTEYSDDKERYCSPLM